MVAANLEILSELKFFLNDAATDPELRRLFSADKNQFTRKRKLPFEQLVAFIINLPKRSLSVELQDFFEVLGQSDTACTKSAFCQQRAKLNPLFFAVWNQWLVTSFYHHYGNKAKRWRGFRVQAVDGSSAYLLHTEGLVAHFGTQSNQHIATPLARVLQVHDVLNDLTVWGNIGPIAKAEQAMFADYIPHLSLDSLSIFDRAYPAYTLLYLMINEETPRHFVMRCKVGFNNEVRAFMRSQKCSKIVNISPSLNARRAMLQYGYIVTAKTSVKVRLVKVKLANGTTEVLMTNLYDERLYPITDLYYLYGLRWGVETAFGKQKNQLQMEQFSGHRVICIEQDYYSGLFVANLQRIIENQSDDYLEQVNARRRLNYKINKNQCWAALKHNIVRLFLFGNEEQILLQLQKAFERNLEPIRIGRKYPRIKKRKRQHGKFQTFTNYKRAF